MIPPKICFILGLVPGPKRKAVVDGTARVSSQSLPPPLTATATAYCHCCCHCRGFCCSHSDRCHSNHPSLGCGVPWGQGRV